MMEFHYLKPHISYEWFHLFGYQMESAAKDVDHLHLASQYIFRMYRLPDTATIYKSAYHRRDLSYPQHLDIFYYLPQPTYQLHEPT